MVVTPDTDDLDLKMGGYEFSSSDQIYPADYSFKIRPDSDDSGLSDVFLVEKDSGERKVLKLNRRTSTAGFPGVDKGDRYEILDELVEISHQNLLTPEKVFKDKLYYEKDGDWTGTFGDRIVEIYDVVDKPVLAERNREVIASDPGRVRDVMEQVVSGLAELHINGFVHNDVHPRNIFYSVTGDSILHDMSHVSEPYQFEGKEEFSYGGLVRPPEYVEGGSIDQQYDVWRLGAIWLYLTHENIPVYALDKVREVKSPHESPLEFPSEDRQIIAGALDPDRETRFSDCEEMLEAFQK